MPWMTSAAVRSSPSSPTNVKTLDGGAHRRLRQRDTGYAAEPAMPGVAPNIQIAYESLKEDGMNNDRVAFRITKLAASIAEGVPLEWQGKELASGPLTIELDEDAQGNHGVLDYARGRAEADFRIRLEFPDLRSGLEDLGVDPALTAPVRATIRSKGKILEDHSFFLSGRCELQPHELVNPTDTAATVLPGT
jgi:hypothetical protein